MESDALKAARARVFSETNDLAAALQPVADRIAALQTALAGGMTVEEQTAAAADLATTGDAFQTSIDALKAMGTPAPA